MTDDSGRFGELKGDPEEYNPNSKPGSEDLVGGVEDMLGGPGDVDTSTNTSTISVYIGKPISTGWVEVESEIVSGHIEPLVEEFGVLD